MMTLQVEFSNGESEEFEIFETDDEVLLDRLEISHIDLTPLASCHDLVKLNLMDNVIEDIDLTPLSSCPSLQSLYLKNNQLDTIDLSPLSSCHNLRELTVTGNSLRQVDLNPLRTCTRLELLGLGANRLKNVDLEPVSSSRELDVLYLYDNRFMTLDLGPLCSCTKLKGLQMYENDLTEIDLAPLSNCIELEILELQTNQLREIDLKPLRNCVQLSKLNLENNSLNGIDLNPLSACTELREFGLSANRIRTLDLSPLVMCKWLKTLYLHENELKKLDLTPLGLAQGLGSGTFDFNFNVNSNIQWVETLFSEENFWSLHSEVQFSIHYDAPSFIPDIAVISQILNKIITSEPRWKTTHLLHNTLSLLGLGWVGMVDTDAASLLTEYFIEQRELDQETLLRRTISLVLPQIDSGSTTIGLDVQRMGEYPELADKFDRVAELRRREMERVKVIETDSGLDLRPLWLTAYGYQILSAQGLGTGCGTDEAISVQHALSGLGFELRTTHSGTAKYVTELSPPLREYIWHLADYRSQLRRLAIEE